MMYLCINYGDSENILILTLDSIKLLPMATDTNRKDSAMQNIVITVSEYTRRARRNMPEVCGFHAVVECEYNGDIWSFTSKLHDTRHQAETLGVYDAIMQAIGMWEDAQRIAAMSEEELAKMEAFERFICECE